MEVFFCTKVKKVKDSDDYDFEHDGIYYKFKNPKMAEAVNKFDGLVDRIDNDYTGDPAPYYACVYFGRFDPNNLSFGDEYIEYDTEILFATKKYATDNISKSDLENWMTIIVPENTDIPSLSDLVEKYDWVCDWLELYKILGANVMRNAGCTTTGNTLYGFTKKEMESRKLECEKHEYFKLWA